jgi:putative ATPase
MEQPLAESLRPATLSELKGQQELTAPGGLINILIKKSAGSNFFPSLIFWGPPGSGKTTLARIIAKNLEADFYEFSAVNTSVKDIEKVIPPPADSRALSLGFTLRKPLVFLDEIHRFSKSQQDTLLPHVERGNIILLGATTENPSFSIIGALLSRCRVVPLKQLGTDELIAIIKGALKFLSATIQDEGFLFLANSSGGDARVTLNVLEIAYHLSDSGHIAVRELEAALQKRQLSFDKNGEEFYNTISAFHKSIRGSDPDGALYWLARMLEAGQDPLYVARRMIRIASEDIGLANSHALVLATACHTACAAIGMPECNLALAETCTYLARCPKSNEVYSAYSAASNDVRQHGNVPVPLHIRNAPTTLMKNLGYGEGYVYSHSPTGTKDPGISYFPDELKDSAYFTGTGTGT